MTRRVLIVAYYFPPLGGIGSVRAVRMARHLPHHGWEPTVLAPSRGTYFTDPALTFDEERVVRTRSLELSRAGTRLLRAPKQGSEPARVGPAQSLARTAARRFLYYPDPQVGWYPFAAAAGLRLLRRERFDAIFSSAFPVTAHLVARTLARRSGIPWVAEFRDPWSDALPSDSPLRGRAARLERAIAGEAARLVMTSPSWARRYSDAWDRPIAVIPNAHDGAAAAPAGPGPVPPVLTYVGSFYPEMQDLSAVLSALGRLRETDPGAMPRLRFVGELQPSLRDQIERAGLADRLEVTGFVSQDEALRLMGASSALLVAGASDDRAPWQGQIPAKAFEYLASGRPIVYVGTPESDAAALLRGHDGCHIVATGDVEGAVAALEQALRGGHYARALAGLSAHARAGGLADLLAESCTRP